MVVMNAQSLRKLAPTVRQLCYALHYCAFQGGIASDGLY